MTGSSHTIDWEQRRYEMAKDFDDDMKKKLEDALKNRDYYLRSETELHKIYCCLGERKVYFM